MIGIAKNERDITVGFPSMKWAIFKVDEFGKRRRMGSASDERARDRLMRVIGGCEYEAIR